MKFHPAVEIVAARYNKTPFATVKHDTHMTGLALAFKPLCQLAIGVNALMDFTALTSA